MKENISQMATRLALQIGTVDQRRDEILNTLWAAVEVGEEHAIQARRTLLGDDMCGCEGCVRDELRTMR